MNIIDIINAFCTLFQAILEDAKTNPEIEERDNHVSDDTDMPPAHTGRGVKTVCIAIEIIY